MSKTKDVMLFLPVKKVTAKGDKDCCHITYIDIYKGEIVAWCVSCGWKAIINWGDMVCDYSQFKIKEK